MSSSSKKQQQADAAAAAASDDIDVILNDFSRNLSGMSGFVFYGMALIVASIPLWLYWRIHMMDPMDNYILWAIMSIFSAILIAKVSISFNSTENCCTVQKFCSDAFVQNSGVTDKKMSKYVRIQNFFGVYTEFQKGCRKIPNFCHTTHKACKVSS